MNGFEFLHEMETVQFVVEPEQRIRSLGSHFRGLGFRRHDDLFVMDRPRPTPPWQPTSLVEVRFQRGGVETFEVQNGWFDTLCLHFLLASLPFEFAETFVAVVEQTSRFLGVPGRYRSADVTALQLMSHLRECRMELLDRTGEEPGSEALAILILDTYPRPCG